MNDTPQGDGNRENIESYKNLCNLIRMNDTPQGDGNFKKFYFFLNTYKPS